MGFGVDLGREGFASGNSWEQQYKELAMFPEQNPSPVLRIDADGVILYSNAAGRALLKSWKTEVGKKAPAEWRAMAERARSESTSISAEVILADKCFSLSLVSVPDAPYVNVYGTDITERKAAEDRATRQAAHFKAIAEVSHGFSKGNPSLPELLDRIAHGVCEVLADASEIHLQSNNVDSPELTAHCSREAKAARALQAMMYSPANTAAKGATVSRKLRIGRPVVVPKISPTTLKTSSPPEYVHLLERFGARSFMFVRLSSEGHTIGEIGLVRLEHDRPAFDEEDVVLAQELAERASDMITRAQLMEQLRAEVADRERAEAAVLRQNRRLAVLREIDKGILWADKVETTAVAALEHVGKLMDSPRTSITLFDWDHGEMVVLEATAAKGPPRERGTRAPIAPFEGRLKRLRKNLPVVINDLTSSSNLSPIDKKGIEEGIRSVCALPLFAEGELVGSFNMSSEIRGFFDSEKVDLAAEVGNQIAIAMEHSRLMEQIRDSEERFRLLFDNSMDGILLTSLDGSVHSANRAACEMFGRSEEEICSLGRSALVDVDNPDLNGMLEERSRTGRMRGEVMLVRKDGSKFPAEMSSAVFRDNQGNERTSVIVRDITERRQAEIELEASERRFRLLFEEMTSAFAVHEMIINEEGSPVDYRFLEVNAAFERLTGLHAVDVLGKTAREVLPNLEPKFIQRYGEVALTGRSIQFESYAGDIGRHYQILAYSPQPGRFATVFDDVSDRKNVETSIRRLNRTYAVLSSINQLIVRERNKKIVFSEVCRIAVEDGNFLLAWIGIVDPTTDRVELVAHAGISDAYVGALNGDASTQPFESGPAATAVREGRVVVCANIEAASTTEPWKEQALTLGFGSSGAFPLRRGDRCIGVLNFYSDEVAFFDEEEVRLLEELAMDVSFGLQSIDIEADRNRAVEELEFKNLLLSTQQEASIDGILVVNERSEIVLYNERFVEMWNIPTEVVQLKRDAPVLELCTRQVSDPSAFVKQVHYLYEHEGEISSDEIQLKNGLFYERYSAPMVGPDGRHFGRVWYFRDVTDRKKSEKALEESERKYRHLAESSPEMIYVVTGDGRVTYANHAAAAQFHSEPRKLSGKLLRDIFPPELARRNLESIREVIETGRAKTNEIAQIFPDGQRWVEARLSPIEDEQGQYNSVLGLSIDITERKRATESLRRLSKAIADSGEVIFMTDRKGFFTFVNPAFTRVYGYSAEEVVGKATPEIVELEGRSNGSYDRDLDLLNSKEAVRGESVGRSRAGDTLVIETTASPFLDEKGDVTGHLWIQSDVTNRRNLEEQVLQAQKMESLGTLASGVAHDFNNILSIILGHLTILERYKDDPNRFATSVATVSKAAWRGAALVGQMLTFARKSDVEVRPIDVNESVREIEKLFRETFPKTVVLETDLAAKLPLVDADSTQVHQILLNLCVNARDAMDGTGTIRIATLSEEGQAVRSRFASANRQRYVEVFVTDNGSGMDDATRERIFEPFFTTKEPGKGTGLGLAVAFGIMQGHGGFIDVESEIGKGSTFGLYFPVPLSWRDETQSGPEEMQESPGGTETILVVEDEQPLRESLEVNLSRNGYTVLLASDGAEAVDLYTSHSGNLDLVVCDLGLPKFSGREVLRRLREVDPKVKFIVATGYIDPAEKSAMIREGVADFVSKPYVPDVLLRSIRRALQ